jgi:hypothetical protein
LKLIGKETYTMTEAETAAKSLFKAMKGLGKLLII